MPIMKTPVSNIALKSEPAGYTNFHPSQPDREEVLKIFATYADDIRSSPASDFSFYDDSQIPLSQWLAPGPFLPELGCYEPGTQCSTAMLPQPSCENSYKDFEERIENPSFWPCNTSSFGSSAACTSSNPHLQRNSASPSLLSYRHSYSEGTSVYAPSSTDEFTNMFDFNFSTSLPNECRMPSTWPPTYPSIGSRKGSSSSAMMYSPSPSCSSLDGSEAKSAASRDSSPSQSESDLQRQRRRFPCLILGCSRRFTSQYTLKVHMEAHKPKPRVSFPCTLGCSERFSRQHDRLRHEVAKHGKICEFLCDDCGRFFSTKKTLGNHKCPVAQGGTRWVNS